MAMSLGGTSIPTSINDRGRYLYKKEVLRTNGDAEAVTAGYATVTWTFEWMTMSDYTWIRDTLLGGAQSYKFSSASLVDDKGATISPTNAVAYRPTYEFASNGNVENVTWEIKRIR